MLAPKILTPFILIATLVAADVIVRHASSNSIPRQVMARINSAPPVIDWLGIGNSLIASDFDSEVVERDFREAGQSTVAVNAGLGSSGVIEHLILADLAFENHTIKNVVYGFLDQQMAVAVPHSNADLMGNRSLLYDREPQLTLRYALFNPLERVEFEVFRSCDLLAKRSLIWTKVERLRRVVQEIGMPHKETNEFGRTSDFNLLEATDTPTFIRESRNVMQSGTYLSRPVQLLVQRAHQHGANVIIMEMPMHPLHLARFYDEPTWQEYRAKTRSAVEGMGASYLDASRWIPEETLFQDHLHLSKAGAATFSHFLAEYLLSQQDPHARIRISAR